MSIKMLKKNGQLLNKELITEIFLFNLCFFLFVWVFFVATPFDIVASNPEEFTYVPGFIILLNGLTYSFIVLLILNLLNICIFLFFRERVRRILLTFSITVAICAWLYSTFLIGIYGEFDGRRKLQIESFGFLSWVQIGVFFAILTFVFVFKNNHKVTTYMVGSVLLISVSTGVINIVSKFADKKLEESSSEEFFVYSKNNPNLLFILLDEYQSDYFAHIIDDDLKKEFKGFIWYKDAASNFPTTIASLPAMFTGRIYENKKDLKDFYRDLSQISIARQFAKIGGHVNYSRSTPMSEHLFPDGSLITFSDLDIRYLTTYSDLINYSLFRASPDIFKRYIYNNEKWLIRLSADNVYDQLGFTGSSFNLLKYIANHEVKALRNYPPTFKFHHSLVTHSPTVLDASCKPIGIVEANLKNRSAEGRCAINKVVDIVRKLKKQNVFNNTMIIVTADHGSVFVPEQFGNSHPYRTAAPTLLIKPLNRNTEFKISDYSAQLSDIPKTIAAAFSISHVYPGVDLLNDSKLQRKTRIFNFYFWSEEYFNFSKSRVPPITTYSINGPIRSPSSWTENKEISPIACSAIVDFSKADQSQYYISKGTSEQEKWGVWSDGDHANIDFKNKPGCKVKAIKFYLNAFVTSKNLEQTARVFINDQPVGRIQITLDEARPKEFTFAIPDVETDCYTVRFEIDNPISPKSVGFNKDTRKLGFGFIRMELVPEIAAQ